MDEIKKKKPEEETPEEKPKDGAEVPEEEKKDEKPARNELFQPR